MGSAPGLRVNDQLVIPDAELSWSFGPSSGPGGQHANTANTRAEVSFDVAGSAVLTPAQRRRLTEVLGDRVRVAAEDSRSQARNRDLARVRMSERLAGALRTTRTRRPTRPTRASKERRLEAKRRRSQRKANRRRFRPDGE